MRQSGYKNRTTTARSEYEREQKTDRQPRRVPPLGESGNRHPPVLPASQRDQPVGGLLQKCNKQTTRVIGTDSD